jgi:hypothetical protein
MIFRGGGAQYSDSLNHKIQPDSDMHFIKLVLKMHLYGVLSDFVHKGIVNFFILNSQITHRYRRA